MDGNTWGKPFRPGPRLFDQPTVASPIGGASPFKLPQRRSKDATFSFLEETQPKLASNQEEKPQTETPQIETEGKETGPFKFSSRKDDNGDKDHENIKSNRSPTQPTSSPMQFPIPTSELDTVDDILIPSPSDTGASSSSEMEVELANLAQMEVPPETKQATIERTPPEQIRREMNVGEERNEKGPEDKPQAERVFHNHSPKLRTQPETPEPRSFSLPKPEQRPQETQFKKLFSLGRFAQEHSPSERSREVATPEKEAQPKPLRERKKLLQEKNFESVSVRSSETAATEQVGKPAQRPETPVTPAATEHRKTSPIAEREKTIPRRRESQDALGFSKPSFQMPNLQGSRLGAKMPNLSLPKRSSAPTPVSSPPPTPQTPTTPLQQQKTFTRSPAAPTPPQSKAKLTLDLLAFSETRKPQEPPSKLQKVQAKPFSSIVEERKDTRFRSVKLDEEKEAKQRKQMDHCTHKREEYENYFISKRQDFTKQIEEMNEMLEESTEKLKEQAVRLYMLNNECLFMDSPILRDQIKQLGKKLQEFSIQDEPSLVMTEKKEE